MPSARILITDPVDTVCANYLQKNGLHVDQIKLTKEQLIENIKNYDGLIVRSETKVTADILAAATGLKVVGRAGTGVDNVDLEAATKKGILVMNTPGGNTLSAAEHTCALIASMARNIPQACASLKQGAWDRKLYSGHELSGKTLAILGLGRIGKEVALRMQSYGMKTIGYDPIIPAEVTAQFGVESMDLEKIWPVADYITVHVPLIPQTKHLINDEVFKKCKPGVKVVNVARGGIIDELSLLKNLKSGLCGGAGLDVFVEEPVKSEYYKELLAHPKMVCTPHLGASTSEAQLRVAEEIAEQFVSFFKGEGFVGAVNAGSLLTAMEAQNVKWVNLGRSLGIFSSILGSVSKFDIITHGSDTPDIKFLESAVVSGYLVGELNDESINLINAGSIAIDKGIQCTVNKGPPPSPPSMKSLRIVATTNKGIFTLIGRVGSDTLGLLTEINNNIFAGGLPLDGTMVFFTGNLTPPGTCFARIDEALAQKDLTAISVFRSNTVGQIGWYAARLADDLSERVELLSSDDFRYLGCRNFLYHSYALSKDSSDED